MRKFIVILLYIIFNATLALPQSTGKIDDILNRINRNKKDTLLVKNYNDLAWELKNQDPPRALAYVDSGLQLALELKYIRGEAFGYYCKGNILDYQSDFGGAKQNYLKAEETYRKISNEKGVSASINNLGNLALLSGDYDEALTLYLKSLAIKERINEKKGLGSTYNNIAIIYEDKRLYDKALEYYNKSLNVKKEVGDTAGMGLSFSNIGGVYEALGDYEKAIEYNIKAVKVQEAINDLSGLALTYNNIASLLLIKEDFNKATFYNEKALELQEQIGDRWGKIYSLIGLGNVNLKMSKWQESEKFLLEAIKIADELKSKKEERDAYKLLIESYEKSGNVNKAVVAYKRFTTLNDSLYTSESNKQIAEMQTKYETVKKEKEIEELNKEKLVQDKEIEKEKTVNNYLIILSILAAFLALIMFKFFKNKQKANQLLSIKNFEIEEQHKKLHEQNLVIELKNKEINESISYAKHIQEAILPSVSINDLIEESFLLYKPKDVVSGDFYWFEQDGDKIYIVVADCTGHGIPGAFMSMIGTILLNEIYNEKKIRKPAEILNALNHLLKLSLKQHLHSQGNRNGMDIGVCVIDRSSRMVEFAGANRPLWIRTGTENKYEIMAINGDKASIGGFTEDDFKFTNQAYHLSDKDIVYMFSDGYADQFGGNKGKKMMTKRLKEELIQMNSIPLKEQKEILSNFYNDWKGHLEQVDDVLLLGFKV